MKEEKRENGEKTKMKGRKRKKKKVEKRLSLLVLYIFHCIAASFPFPLSLASLFLEKFLSLTRSTSEHVVESILHQNSLRRLFDIPHNQADLISFINNASKTFFFECIFMVTISIPTIAAVAPKINVSLTYNAADN